MPKAKKNPSPTLSDRVMREIASLNMSVTHLGREVCLLRDNIVLMKDNVVALSRVHEDSNPHAAVKATIPLTRTTHRIQAILRLTGAAFGLAGLQLSEVTYFDPKLADSPRVTIRL